MTLSHQMAEVMGPGLHYDVPAAVYHADPCERPSLSSSIAKVLLDQSPLHAWYSHPRLGLTEDDSSDPTRPKEIGTAAHKLILGRGAEVVVIEDKAYLKKVTKEGRADAYAAGKVPVLEPDHAKAVAMAVAVTEQLARVPGCEGFAAAASEVVGICHDVTGAHLRCMIDKLELHDTHAILWDIKTGEQSGAPQGLGKRIANMGFDVSAAFYIRVLEQLMPHLAGRITFRWVFIENDAPHLITVAELDNTGLEIGKKKVSAAIGLWNRAMESGVWAGYPAEVILAEYPGYSEAHWLAREEFDPAINSLPMDPIYFRDSRPSGRLSEIAS
jgi:hypothetical protein